MSFLKTCKIDFHSPNSTYYAGQCVTGTVQFTLNKGKYVKDMLLELKGYAKVAWSETYGSNTIHYSSREDYFSEVSTLVTAPGEDSATVEIPQGDHKFDFSFQLPDDIPSSFESAYGSVRYKATVIVNKPWKKNKTNSVIFTVLSYIDLSLNPVYSTPRAYKYGKTNFSLFNKSGQLWMDVLMPGTGFVTGQDIPIRLNIKNESRTSVNRFSAQLIQVVKYVASSNTCSRTRKIACMRMAEMVKGNTTKEIDVPLKIPSIPPSTTIPESNITISYFIKITAEIPGTHFNLNGQFPITIGTIPFNNQYDQPPTTSEKSYPFPEYTALEQYSHDTAHHPPPSYEESMQSMENLNEDNDDKPLDVIYENDYQLKYPIFNVQPPK